jgi:hypothetical protein
VFLKCKAPVCGPRGKQCTRSTFTCRVIFNNIVTEKSRFMYDRCNFNKSSSSYFEFLLLVSRIHGTRSG